MPIPGFTIDGVLPPYIGPGGPGGAAEDLSPYTVTSRGPEPLLFEPFLASTRR